MAKFIKGKKTGMVMKSVTKGKTETISRAKKSDIKGMATKDKIKFSSAIKEGGRGKGLKGAIKGLASKAAKGKLSNKKSPRKKLKK